MPPRHHPNAPAAGTGAGTGASANANALTPAQQLLFDRLEDFVAFDSDNPADPAAYNRLGCYIASVCGSAFNAKELYVYLGLDGTIDEIVAAIGGSINVVFGRMCHAAGYACTHGVYSTMRSTAENENDGEQLTERQIMILVRQAALQYYEFMDSHRQLCKDMFKTRVRECVREFSSVGCVLPCRVDMYKELIKGLKHEKKETTAGRGPDGRALSDREKQEMLVDIHVREITAIRRHAWNHVMVKWFDILHDDHERLARISDDLYESLREFFGNLSRDFDQEEEDDLYDKESLEIDKFPFEEPPNWRRMRGARPPGA
jgi:hypothetical protein